MIKLERSLLEGLDAEHPTLEAVQAALQSAIELEHSTIPVYLYALFSLRAGTNRQIAAILKSVVVEEMLHMVLAANVLNALGASPAISTKDFIPSFPGRLPGGVEEQLTLHLRAFSLDQLQTFIDLEEPRDPLNVHAGSVDDVPTTTIGEFYTAIATAVAALGNDAFVGPSERQVGPDLMFGSISVSDVASALNALDTIIEQGEGTGTSPEEVDGPDGVDDYAHYYRLTQIREGRALVRTSGDDEAPQYAFAGDEIAFDADGIVELPEDPCAQNYPTGSPERLAMDTFNFTYTTLLTQLHDLVNGHADMTCFGTALSLMESLAHQARAMASGVAVPGRVLGPSFEYQPVDPHDDVDAQLNESRA
ncbi:MAG TPA: ferritin-like protein [Acidimicrobiales bacterium]|nr:ferritin-like protein [Acidimicrobiales bacterium]